MARYTYSQLVGFAQNAGFQGQSAYTAAAIGMAESSGNSNAIAYNDGGKGYNSYGIMQINGVNDRTVGGASNALDPQTSFNQAYILSNGGSNFSPWSTYKSGAYQQYLDPSVSPTGSDGGSNLLQPDYTTVGDTVTGNVDPTTGETYGYSNSGGSSGGSSTSSSTSGLTQGQGTPVQLNLGQSTVQDVSKWISEPITAAEQWAAAQFDALTNWFTRGALIAFAIVVILVALWRLSGGPNTTQIIQAARAAA